MFVVQKCYITACGADGLYGKRIWWGSYSPEHFLGCFYFGGKFNTVSSNLGTNLDEMKPLRGSQGTEKEVCNNYHGCVTGCVAKCL